MRARMTCLVLAVASVIVLSLGVLGACSSSSSNDEEEIDESLAESLDSIKNLDGSVVEDIESYVGADALDAYGIDVEEFARTYFDGFDYSVDSIDVDGDNADVTLTISCKSMSLFEDDLTEELNNLDAEFATEREKQGLSGEDYDQEEFDQYVGSHILDVLEDVNVVETNPLSIEMTKTDGTWEQPASFSEEIAQTIENS